MSIVQVLRSVAGFVSVCAIGVPALQPVEAREPVVLVPSSPWNLDYGENRCKLLRIFGEGEDKTVLLLMQLSPSSRFEFTVAGDPLRIARRGRPVSVQMGPGFPPHDRAFQPGTLGDYDPALIFGNVSPEHDEMDADVEEDADKSDSQESELAIEKRLSSATGEQIEWLEFRVRGRTVRLDTGKLDGAFDAMNTCTADLLGRWGVDPEAFATIVTGPEVTNIKEVATRIQRNYPSKALDRGQMATIQLRMIVDESGLLTECTQLDITAAENFNSLPCAIFRNRAKFEPARDASGKPVKSYKMQRIRYILP